MASETGPLYASNVSLRERVSFSIITPIKLCFFSCYGLHQSNKRPYISCASGFFRSARFQRPSRHHSAWSASATGSLNSPIGGGQVKYPLVSACLLKSPGTRILPSRHPFFYPFPSRLTSSEFQQSHSQPQFLNTICHYGPCHHPHSTSRSRSTAF